MGKNLALKIISVISIGGMLFSGYLSYNEIIRSVCAVGGCSSIVGVPICVYGFFMYALVFIIAFAGIKSRN